MNIGSGTPESAVTAPVGVLFRRTDGGRGSAVYYKSNGTGSTGWLPFGLGPSVGVAIASTGTIAPTAKVTHITGTNAIATITATGITDGDTIILIPDGAFTWTTAGNIAVAGTAVVNRALHLTYDATTTKWYPSYV
jgi:hypothetical protein